MKKILSALLLLTMLIGAVSCAADTEEEYSDNAQESDSSVVSNESAEVDTSENTEDGKQESSDDVCTHNYTSEITTSAMALRDGVTTLTCSLCGDSYKESIPATKTIKILAIGNSQSVDAMEYLWDICKDGGAETVILGNLHIDDGTLEKHWEIISGGTGGYTYSKNTNGEWVDASDVSAETALKDESWDIITVQQSVGVSGQGGTYLKLRNITKFLDQNKTNPDAKIVWHMTWAYQQNSVSNDFSNYSKDQMTMYKAITDTVQAVVIINNVIDGVIPCGTAIQNLRATCIGDTVTRDGCNLSYSYGRYTAALVWYTYLTGGSLESIDWVPSSYSGISDDLAIIKEAVGNAIKAAYEVTKPQLDSSTNPTVKTYERVNTTFLDWSGGPNGKNTDWIYGTTHGSENTIKYVWDGVTDTTYCLYLPHNNGKYSWTSARLDGPTVIGKIGLATIWAPNANIGTAIQASVDGENWTTLYTLSESDGSFVQGEQEWKLERLDIEINDTTEYNYVRVYDTAGGGYCFAEVEIYTTH